MSVDAINGGENYFNDLAKKVQPTIPNTSTVQKLESVLSNGQEATSNGANAEVQENLEESGKQDPNSAKKFKDAITGANNKLVQKRTRCEFSYHEDVNRISIKVYDRETDKVLKEIPAEETLEMLEKIWDLAGLLVDEKR